MIPLLGTRRQRQPDPKPVVTIDLTGTTESAPASSGGAVLGEMGVPPPKPKPPAPSGQPKAKMPHAAEQMAECQARCAVGKTENVISAQPRRPPVPAKPSDEDIARAEMRCLLYTSDAADDM
eukprot:3161860-Alexandrium_andersonii.AAC.1